MSSKVKIWMLVFTVLVMVVLGRGLLVRGIFPNKNDISTFSMCYFTFCMATIFWIFAVYSTLFD